MSPIHRTLVLQPIIPPYRVDLFHRLSEIGGNQFTFASGEPMRGAGLVSVECTPGLAREVLINREVVLKEHLAWQQGVLSLVRSKRFDTVVAAFNPRYLSSIAAMKEARRQDVRFIWWGHGIRPKSGPFDIRVYLHLAKAADALIFYSQQGADQMVALGIPREKAFVAHNSLNIQEIDRYALPDETGRFRILYVGRLIEEKKVELLLDGFSQALAKMPSNIVLTILGDGPAGEACRRKAHELNLGARVEFVSGTYEQADLAPFFNTAICSVSPGYIGLSAIHSLAYSVPILVADQEPHSPEIEAIEFGFNSFSFRANDASDLADKLVHLTHSSNLAMHLGKNGRAKIDADYSVEKMAGVFQEAIQYAHS